MSYSYANLMKFKNDSRLFCGSLREVVLAMECAVLLNKKQTSITFALRDAGISDRTCSKALRLVESLRALGFHATRTGFAGGHNCFEVSWHTERLPWSTEDKYHFGAEAPRRSPEQHKLPSLPCILPAFLASSNFDIRR